MSMGSCALKGFLTLERRVAFVAGGVDAGTEVVEAFACVVQRGKFAVVHGHGESIGVGKPRSALAARLLCASSDARVGNIH